MAYTEIDSADIQVGKPTKKSLWQKIRDNFIDHESRITALSTGANKIEVMEYYLKPDDLEIGRIISSNMTTSEFQQIHGAGWVLCDGSSASGSLYNTITGHSIVPDLRGEFLRGANGSSVLNDTKYADATAVNGLSSTTVSDGAHTHSYESYVSPSVTNYYNDRVFQATSVYANDVKVSRTTSSDGAHTHTINMTGDSETRPNNHGVNFFIKINLSAHDKVIRFKAREDMTIVNVKGYIVDNAGLPTSGNFEFDIKKGATIAALSTVYSVKPTLAWSGGIADGDATSSGTVLAGGYDVTAGDWLQLDITSLMVGQSGVYIQVFAEPA